MATGKCIASKEELKTMACLRVSLSVRMKMFPSSWTTLIIKQSIHLAKMFVDQVNGLQHESVPMKINKLDEQGMEVAVCRHGVLLRSLNMMRGEIFAYPMFLQKELTPRNVQFMCTDVICKYWPYLQRVVRDCPELSPLLDMKPFLSVMHAKAHSWKCEIKWGGRNQEGAGTTLGEEVEQVNSFLSRTAICSKYMTKGARTDMITIQAMAWNKRKIENLAKLLSRRLQKTQAKIQEASRNITALKTELAMTDDTLKAWSKEIQEWADTATSEANMGSDQGLQKTIESLYESIRQRKQDLYRQSDGNKRRHKIRRKIWEEKAKFIAAIDEYNRAAPQKLQSADTILASEGYAWPWVLDERELDCGLSEKGVLGLRSVLQKRMCYLRTHMSSLQQLYTSVLNNCVESANIIDDDFLEMDEVDIQFSSDYDDEEVDNAELSFEI
ncbi:uncharacterized protein [Danio rerio]|uniref:Uncharacterized protein n=1 Tax=Danio rerio TaxID=7955 RepID=A0AC58JB59_DANRE